jgi:hypothetical protein
MDRLPLDRNPYLENAQVPSELGQARGTIDRPGQVPNVPWQTRRTVPSAYEDALGDALERVFEAGAVELVDVVAQLNALGSRTPTGQPWTAESFQETMRQLAAE